MLAGPRYTLYLSPCTRSHALDRRIFAYRRVVSDNTLTCIMVISTFFASVSFIVVFLGLESVLEGFSAGQGVSLWVSHSERL